MKKLVSLFAFLLSASILPAQDIHVYTAFGDSGTVLTSLRRPNTFNSTIQVMPDGNLLLLGGKPSPNGTILCKYNTLGDSLQGFAPSTYSTDNQTIYTFRVMPDGGFLVADSDSLKGLKRFDPDSVPDLNFGDKGGANTFRIGVKEIILGQNGRIFVTGTKAGEGVSIIAYTADGNIDSSFAANGVFTYSNDGFDFFNGLHELPDGKLVAGGCSFPYGGGDSFNSLCRLTPNGVPDSTFGVNGFVKEYHIDGGDTWGTEMQPDGKVLTFGTNTSDNVGYIARYMPNGALDPGFGYHGKTVFPAFSQILDAEVLPNGKILVYGEIKSPNGVTGIVQLSDDGWTDPFFGYGGIYFSPFERMYSAHRMQMIGNKIFATGNFNVYDSIANQSTVYMKMQAFVLGASVGTTSNEISTAVTVYPNPVQEALEMRFSLETAQDLQFDLYDLQGKRLQTLQESTWLEAGEQQVSLKLNPSIPGGVYVLTISSGERRLSAVQVLKI
jgi:uncharacterized delta-60 repeat protein